MLLTSTFITIISVTVPLYASDIPKEILEAYDNYNIILHYDNKTFCNISNDILKVQKPKLLINYDLSINTEIDRPAGGKFMHLIHLDPTRKIANYANKKRSFVYYDVIFVMQSDYATIINEKVWHISGFKKAANLFIANLKGNEFYYVKYYDAENAKLIKIKDKPLNFSKYHNDFSNFYGYNFSIGVVPERPHVWCEIVNKTTHEFICKGPELNLLNLLSKSLNFTFALTHYEENKPESFLILVSKIKNDSFDWGIAGLFVNIARIGFLDYPSVLFRDSYATAYPYDYIDPSVNHHWHFIIKPFKIEIWLLLVLAVISLLVFYEIVHYLMNQEGFPKTFYMIPVRTLTEQSCTKKEMQFIKFAIIFLIFWYFSQIITASYKSQLTSASIQMRDPLPRSIRELYEAKYDFYMLDPEMMVVADDMKASNETIYKKIGNKLKNSGTFCANTIDIVNNRGALLSEYATLKTEILRCEGITPQILQRLAITKKEMYPTITSWGLQKDSPFRKRFSIEFERILAAGIIQLWYKEVLSDQVRDADKIDFGIQATPLKLYNLLDAALVLLAGLLLSFLCFIVEMAWFHMECLLPSKNRT